MVGFRNASNYLPHLLYIHIVLLLSQLDNSLIERGRNEFGRKVINEVLESIGNHVGRCLFHHCVIALFMNSDIERWWEEVNGKMITKREWK